MLKVISSRGIILVLNSLVELDEFELEVELAELEDDEKNGKPSNRCSDELLDEVESKSLGSLGESGKYCLKTTTASVFCSRLSCISCSILLISGIIIVSGRSIGISAAGHLKIYTYINN